MCGGFTCSKNALISLNILYILVSFILIGVAVYGRAASLVTNLPIVGGILACGVILFLISLLGLVGAVKHHQVMLFLSKYGTTTRIGRTGVGKVGNNTKMEVQQAFSCCGFDGKLRDNPKMDHPSCSTLKCCPTEDECHCPTCMNKLQSAINYAFKLCGWIGLFFSFTEVVGMVLTRHYRNLTDPDEKVATAIFPSHNFIY